MGSPPNCRPECSINSECPSNKACIQEKCRDPCLGSCGFNAICTVINHTPACSCSEQDTGDPFTNCHPKPPPCKTVLSLFNMLFIISPSKLQYLAKEPPHDDPCNPSPCGPNAQCSNGACKCLPEYQGDPYSMCRPECVINNDCPRDKSCVRNKCIDPCPGPCGQNAVCNAINHISMCSCPPGMSGNAFVECSPYRCMYTNVFCFTHSTFVFFVRLSFAQPLLKPILVNHHHVDQTHNVDKSMNKQSVHVFLDTLEDLQHVDQNVSQVLNALKTRLAITKNVLILALEPVVLMQNVKSETIVQSVLVH